MKTDQAPANRRPRIVGPHHQGISAPCRWRPAGGRMDSKRAVSRRRRLQGCSLLCLMLAPVTLAVAEFKPTTVNAGNVFERIG